MIKIVYFIFFIIVLNSVSCLESKMNSNTEKQPSPPESTNDTNPDNVTGTDEQVESSPTFCQPGVKDNNIAKINVPNGVCTPTCSSNGDTHKWVWHL